MPPSLPRRLDPAHAEALHGVAATRVVEAAAQVGLAPGTLMDRAGQAVARLLRAWQPMARHIDVICGPGNNGGDALVAATALHRHLQATGGPGRVRAWLWPHADATRPADAARALQLARDAGLPLFPLNPPANGPWPWEHDTEVLIDGLLGIGARALAPGAMGQLAQVLAESHRPVLCIDVPSGLDADTGLWTGTEPRTSGPRTTLSLLTVKPGLLTGHGRDRAGDVWFDPLRVDALSHHPATAMWGGRGPVDAGRPSDPHAGHKGRYGDVAVLPGQALSGTGQGMSGAAVLAARAALHGGAGRVYLGVPDSPASPEWDAGQPELMLRHAAALMEPSTLAGLTVVAGCGGGSGIAPALPAVMAHASFLVLDADGLNAVAAAPALQDGLRQRGWPRTVITPHPLEAARLLGSTTAAVMADRLAAAGALAERLQVVCVLKGSGTVVAAPGHRPWINGTGNARLATAGTGDVLAGLIGARLAGQPRDLLEAVQRAVQLHGALADHWDDAGGPLTAAALAARVRPV